MTTYENEYLGVDVGKMLSDIKAQSLPEKLGPFKTSDIIGFSMVASIGLTTFILVRKFRKKGKRK